MHRLLREPTVHFAVLAAALFAISWGVEARQGAEVEIDAQELDWRVSQVALVRGAPLSEAERRAVEEAYVEERILALEARKLGLDQDARIDDILVQKMLHVLSGDVIQPSEAELEQYFAANRDRFAAPPTVTVDELLLTTEGPLPPELRRGLSEGVDPADLVGDVPSRLGTLQRVNVDDLAAIFSAETAAKVFAASQGEWVGPHHTVRGQHWLRVTERVDPPVPALDSVREEVRLSWIREEEERRLAERIADLRRTYSVEVVEASEPE